MIQCICKGSAIYILKILIPPLAYMRSKSFMPLKAGSERSSEWLISSSSWNLRIFLAEIPSTVKQTCKDLNLLPVISGYDAARHAKSKLQLA